MQSLKKMCDGDVDNWPAYVKFTQLAYNTKVHSRTRYTPLELLTGVNNSPFDNFSNKKVSLLANSVSCDQALEDLRDMLNEKRKIAINNIEKGQAQQIKVQNERSRIITNRLPVGTRVYVEVKSLHDKLHEKYKGPYTVVEVDELRGTYRLADKRGKTLNDNFQLNRLKLDLEPLNSDNTAQIKNLEPRKIARKNSLNSDRNIIRRSPRIKAQVTSNLILGMLFIAIFINVSANKSSIIVNKLKNEKMLNNKFKIEESDSSIILTGLYNVCEKHKDLWSRPIVFNNECKIKRVKIKNQFFEPGKILKYTKILSEVTNKIHGDIFICEIKEVQLLTYENFFGAKTIERKIKNIAVSENECNFMIATKECKGNPMVCDGNFCSHDGTPEESYEYMSESVKLGYSCKTKKKFISLKDKESIVFNKCKVKELRCKLKNSIAVWNDNIIIKCPYKLITHIHTLEIKHNNILTNNKNALFQINNKMIICDNIIAFTTTEGLLITTDTRVNKLETETIEFSALHELILSEADMNTNRAIENLNKIKINNCLQQTEILNLMILKEDNYFRLIAQNKKDTILYVKNRILHIPRCFSINSIVIKKAQRTSCNSDIEIEFKIKNKTTLGYLNDERIIRMIPRKQNCEPTYVQREFPDHLLIKKLGIVSIRKPSNKILTTDLLELKESELNFLHYEELLDGINIFDEIVEEVENVLDDELDTHQDVLTFKSQSKFKSETLESGKEFLTKIQNYFYNNLKFIIGGLTTLIILYASITIVKLIMKYRINKIVRNQEDVALQEIQTMLRASKETD